MKSKQKARLTARIRKLEKIQHDLRIELKLLRYSKTVSVKEMRGMTKVALSLAEVCGAQVELALFDMKEVT